ncbi:MAG: hypothetical protein WBW31_09550 [Candidatus Sulfotelmatobacter sp.]
MFDNRHLGIIKSGTDEMSEITAAPSPAELRAFIDKEMKNADEVVNRQKAGDDFVIAHPEYIDGGPTGQHNARLMRHELQATGRWPNPSLEDYEAVYHSLSQDGLLKLNQSKIDAQRAADLDARAAEIKANRFDETKAYSMTADQLRAKARGHEFENDPLCPSASRV